MCASFLEESPIGMLNLKMLMYGLVSIFKTLLGQKFILTQFSGKSLIVKEKKNTVNQGKVVFTTSYHGVLDLSHSCSYPAISTNISTKISQIPITRYFSFNLIKVGGRIQSSS